MQLVRQHYAICTHVAGNLLFLQRQRVAKKRVILPVGCLHIEATSSKALAQYLMSDFGFSTVKNLPPFVQHYRCET
jgi:hypothetical protein